MGWGFIISQIIGPLLAYTSVRFVNLQADNHIGFIIIGCTAPALVSGIVLAEGTAGYQPEYAYECPRAPVADLVLTSKKQKLEKEVGE